jgi:hypothetical protein
LSADRDIIELRATHPDGDLACDFTIANEKAREGLDEALRSAIRPPVRRLPDGVEVHFEPGAWDVVHRYVELESRCCSFLSLNARRTADDVTLTVTGRPDALAVIEQIFPVT